MSLLIETEHALTNYAGDNIVAYGSHLSDDIRVSPGRVIGEEEYRVLEHNPADIVPFSYMSMVTGKHFVNVTFPSTPLEMQFVRYHHQDSSDPAIKDAKQRLTHSLIKELIEARPGFTDTASFYDVGTVVEDVETLQDGEIIKTKNEKEASDIIERICSAGLTFVLSDFEGFTLEEGKFVNAVGVKINHPAEKRIALTRPEEKDRKRGRFEIRTGKLRALGNYEEVDHFNEHILKAHHDKLESRMRLAGFVVARAVFRQDELYPFNVDEADLSIAEAIRELVERQA